MSEVADAVALARRMLREYEITGWTVVIDNARRRAGQTRYGPRELSLSRHLIARNPMPVIRDIILHEIAHILAGEDHGHDRVWRAIHRSIGGDGRRCYRGDEVDMPPPAWLGTCGHQPAHEFRRHRLARSMRTGVFCTLGPRDSAQITWRKTR